MFCEHCGTKLDDDSVFCINCGAKLDYAEKIKDTEIEDNEVEIVLDGQSESPKTEISENEDVLLEKISNVVENVESEKTASINENNEIGEDNNNGKNDDENYEIEDLETDEDEDEEKLEMDGILGDIKKNTQQKINSMKGAAIDVIGANNIKNLKKKTKKIKEKIREGLNDLDEE